MSFPSYDVCIIGRLLQVTSVIATVEDSLGVASPEEMVEKCKEDKEQEEKETRRLAEGECL